MQLYNCSLHYTMAPYKYFRENALKKWTHQQSRMSVGTRRLKTDLNKIYDVSLFKKS